MPKYLLQASYTPQGVEGVRTKGGSSRRDAVAEAVSSVGGQVESFHFGFGDEDSYVDPPAPSKHSSATRSPPVTGGR